MRGRNPRGSGRIYAGVTLACFAGGGAQLVAATSVRAQVSAITGVKFTGGIVDSLVTGPDGALWCTWVSAPGNYGLTRVTTSGAATTWSTPGSWTQPVELGDITSGAGALWIAESHDNHRYIGKWSTAGSLITEFAVPTYAYAMAFGPDGNIWFGGGAPAGIGTMSNAYIGRMTPTGGITSFPLPDPTHLAAALTVGPDGALWFSEAPGPNVGRITTSGTITEFPIPGAQTQYGAVAALQNITTGPDSALWYVDGTVGVQRISTGGVVTAVGGTPAGPMSVTLGPDGNLWVTGSSWVAKMTTAGAVTEYPIPAALAIGVTSVITSGPDGALWFGQQGELLRLDPSLPPDTTATAPRLIAVPATGAVSRTVVAGALLFLAGVSLLGGMLGRRTMWRRRPPSGGCGRLPS